MLIALLLTYLHKSFIFCPAIRPWVSTTDPHHAHAHLTTLSNRSESPTVMVTGLELAPLHTWATSPLSFSTTKRSIPQNLIATPPLSALHSHGKPLIPSGIMATISAALCLLVFRFLLLMPHTIPCPTLSVNNQDSTRRTSNPYPMTTPPTLNTQFPGRHPSSLAHLYATSPRPWDAATYDESTSSLHQNGGEYSNPSSVAQLSANATLVTINFGPGQSMGISQAAIWAPSNTTTG